MRRFFQTIFKPFKKAWVWYLILLLVLSALVWFVGPFLGLNNAGWRLFIILIFVIAWAINALRLQRKKLREELEQELTQNNQQSHVDQTLIDKAIADLQGKYRKALQTVAQRNPWTLFITFRRNQLPWYLVLGSPGSGKTTLLTESGLHFPLGNDALIDMKDKPEVLVQWRFAKDAVFIDTDGVLTTFTNSDSLAGKVWHELLELMAWHRIRKSLNGIILTVSMQELLAQTPEQRRQLAHSIRSRIGEIETEVGIKYPVYVQVTKTDILAGFREFFDKFTETQRDQIWGMTFPDRDTQDSVQLFPEEFDLLVARLNDYLLNTLEGVREISTAALVAMFASQFSSTKAPLQSFLNQVFETNHYQERGYLRAIFFVSARQNTKPINRLLLDGRSFGLQQGDIPLKAMDNRAYFIEQAFRSVILQETHLLQMSTDQARKMNLHRKSVYIVVGGIVGLMANFWANSFMMNHSQLKKLHSVTENYLQDYQAYYTGHSEVPPSLSELYEMRHLFDENTDPLSMHWGLYQGERFSDPINTIYLIQLRRQFVPLLQATVEDELRKDMNNPSQSYNFLRVYLMLADPSKMESDFVASWLELYWQNSLPGQPILQATLNENLVEYLNLDKTGIKPDQNLIESVRTMLQNTSPAERVYFELEKESGSRQVEVSNQFDSDFSQIFGQGSLNQKILYLYTKAGYEDIYKKDLNTLINDVADSNWILGRQDVRSLTPDELESIKRYVQVMYMEKYTQAWLDVLSKYKIETFNSLSEAANVLALLSQPTSPLKQLLDEVYKNTTLEKGDANPVAMAVRKGKSTNSLVPKTPSAAKSALSTQALEKAGMQAVSSSALFGNAGANDPTTPVGAAFFDLNTIVRSSHDEAKPGAKDQSAAPSGYAAIQTALSNLNAYVQNITNSPDPNRAAFEAAVAHVSSEGDALGKLVELANSSPEPLKEWLADLADNTWGAILGGAKAYINQAWQQNVWASYQQLIQFHYPLFADAQNETSLTDFAVFFAPGGVYDTFFQQYLKPFINVGDESSLVAVDGHSLPISNNNIYQLQLVYYIQQAFFGNNKQVSVPFAIRPIDLSQTAASASLQVAGIGIDYGHGPIQPTHLVWPEANPTQMASLTIYDLTGAQQSFNTSGDWAWLRLLDKGTMQRTYSSSIMNVTFNINGRIISYALEVKNKYNAFDLVKLHQSRLPQNL